ncbi:MAG: transglutaminase TgpA family protein [Acidiferrobacteraceae bacterium]
MTLSKRGPVATPLPALLPIVAGLSLLPLADHLPWWTLVFATALLIWRVHAERRSLPPVPLPLKLCLALAALAAVYAQFHTLRGAEPGFSFFVAMFGLKVLETKTRRDLVVLVLLSYIALLGGLVFAQSVAIGLYALGFLVLSLVTLGTIAQPVGPPLKNRFQLALTLLIKALPLALIVYLLFPRLAGGLWGMTATHRTAETGLSDVLRPGAFTRLIPSRRVAFRVLFKKGDAPPRDRRYFRVYVMTRTDGRSWRVQRRGQEVERPTATRANLRYTLLLQPTDRRALPALDWPLPIPGAMLVTGDLLRAHRPVNHLFRYRARATLTPPSSLTPAARTRDLALPQAIDPRILKLAQHLAGGAQTAAARIAHTLHYFVAHGFVYTLAPPPMGRDPLATFLFKAHRGYCTDYAAAFATLMRAEGVPSRVVVGYAGGTYNPVGHDFIVRARDAHAWTEVWLKDHWQRVDPTAVVAPAVLDYGVGAILRLTARGHWPLPTGQKVTRRLLARPFWSAARYRLMLWHDAFTTTWDYWVTNYNWRRQERLLHALGWRDVRRMSLGGAVFAFAMLGILATKAFGTRAPRPRDPATAAYLRFHKRLARIGLPKHPHEGPSDYAARVTRIRPDLAPQVAAITRAYIDARYGRGKLNGRRLKTEIRRFRPRKAP